MAAIFTFVEKYETFLNYNGELDVTKYSMYVPIILNRKVVYAVGSPFETNFHILCLLRATAVMHRVFEKIAATNLLWKCPRRMDMFK